MLQIRGVYPGSGWEKVSIWIRIRVEQPGSYFLELKNHFFAFFGLKYLNSLMRIRDPGWRQFGRWLMEIGYWTFCNWALCNWTFDKWTFDYWTFCNWALCNWTLCNWTFRNIVFTYICGSNVLLCFVSGPRFNQYFSFGTHPDTALSQSTCHHTMAKQRTLARQHYEN